MQLLVISERIRELKQIDAVRGMCSTEFSYDIRHRLLSINLTEPSFCSCLILYRAQQYSTNLLNNNMLLFFFK